MVDTVPRDEYGTLLHVGETVVTPNGDLTTVAEFHYSTGPFVKVDLTNGDTYNAHVLIIVP